MNEHPVVLAELCNDNYPVKETIIQGKPVHHYSTVTIKGDSIPCPSFEGKNGKIYAPKVKCPDQTVLHDSVTVTDTLYQENTAKLRLVLNDLSNLNNEVETERKRTQAANSRFVWAICLGVIGIISARIFKF